jgi:cyanophycinase
MSTRLLLSAAIWLFVGPSGLSAQTVGPAHGTLLLAGGGVRDPEIYRSFVELAGGPDARIVVIPTAGERDAFDSAYGGLEVFRAAGADHVTVLHTRNRGVADSESFVRPLRDADAIWFSGGRQWRLVDAYGGTKTEIALRDLLERGGVIGGSSAGATIQGSYLVRGDSRTNTITMGDHEVGFGFLRNVAVDQHVLRRNRQFDLVEVIRVHPELLGIGIEENTAIVVTGDTFEVIGNGYVLIYDVHRTIDGKGRFYFLSPGDRFDLGTREARRGDGEGEPLERVTTVPWPTR